MYSQLDILGGETQCVVAPRKVNRIAIGLVGVLRAARRGEHFTMHDAFARTDTPLPYTRYWLPVAKRAVKARLIERYEQHVPPGDLRASGSPVLCSRVFLPNCLALNPVGSAETHG